MSDPSTTAGLASVLVTGGASGLGAAVVGLIRKRGGRAWVLDANETEGDADSTVVDVSDTDATARAVDDAATAMGGLTGVVTAAGTDACGALADVPAADWERVVRVNLMGTAAVIRSALPHLRRRRGRVVAIGSTHGYRAHPGASAYAASKFGIMGLTRSLAQEEAGQVGVSMVAPGGMDTAFFDGRPEQYRPGPDAQLNPPDAVAESVVFCLTQPPGCEVRELLVTPSTEPSWP